MYSLSFPLPCYLSGSCRQRLVEVNAFCFAERRRHHEAYINFIGLSLFGICRSGYSNDSLICHLVLFKYFCSLDNISSSLVFSTTIPFSIWLITDRNIIIVLSPIFGIYQIYILKLTQYFKFRVKRWTLYWFNNDVCVITYTCMCVQVL